MSKVIKLKKGLDIKLDGKAEMVIDEYQKPFFCALKPTDFRVLTPRLMVKIGDEVKAGDVLFIDKQNPEIKFTSPVSGVVDVVNRGERRKLLEVVVKVDDEIKYQDFGKIDVETLKREDIIERLLNSGVWPLIKQRPYDIIANPTSMPKAIYVSGFDSAPLATDYEKIIALEKESIQTGLNCLKILCDKNVNLGLKNSTHINSVFNTLKNVDVDYYEGKHPAGNVGVQIHHTNPINKGEVVWTVNIQDVLIIGRLFTEGVFNAKKVIALTGSEVIAPKYYKTILGANIKSLVDSKLKNNVEQRIISGNVLTGTKVEEESFLGYYDNQITVIPEGRHSEFLGWASPGFSKFSASRLFPSFLCSNKTYTLDTNYHGEVRGFVLSGQYETVFPMDIYPVYLLKAALAGDIEQMEQLGIYEVAPEDFALCDVICTSKTEAQQIINDGILLMIKETN